MYLEKTWQVIDLIRKTKKKQSLRKEFHVPFVQPNNTYDNLVCITGFGHSGSGAVLDFLTEFNNTTVFGFYDKEFSGFKKDAPTGEVNLFRCAGGLFDIEEALDTSGYFNQNFIVKLFLHAAQYYYLKGGMYSDKFWQLTNKFIDEIVDFKIPAQNSFEGLYYLGLLKSRHKAYKNVQSPLLCNNKGDRYIYYLKNMSKQEYRKIARNYILSFLKTVNSKEFLVLDQVLTTFEPDIDKKLEYFGDFKLICVYRDPRDTYVTGVLKNEDWMPKNPQDFVKWYIKRGVKKYIDTKHPNMLCIRFEDFVLNNENEKKKIMKFLGLKSANWDKRKTYFIPEISIKNVGLYKNYKQQSEIKYIENCLSDFIYPISL